MQRFIRQFLLLTLLAILPSLGAVQADENPAAKGKAQNDQAPSCAEMFAFSATQLRGSNTVDFCEQFSGKPLLVVNTASQCGFTPQFKQLEAIYQQYQGQLNIVGFPSDDFNQEFDEAQQIEEVCYQNYGVTFTMVEPSAVTGEGANPLFKRLTEVSGQAPQWNFTKYLVSADGETVMHFASAIEPQSATMIEAIESLIN